MRGSKAGGGMISHVHSDWPQAPPSLLYDSYWVSFPAGKAGWAWCWPPTPILRQGCKRVGASPPYALCACMSWDYTAIMCHKILLLFHYRVCVHVKVSRIRGCHSSVLWQKKVENNWSRRPQSEFSVLRNTPFLLYTFSWQCITVGVLTVIYKKFMVSYSVMLYGLVNGYECFRGTKWLHLQIVNTIP